MKVESTRFINYMEVLKDIKLNKIVNEEKLLKLFNNNYFIFLFGQFNEEAYEIYLNILNTLKIKKYLKNSNLTEDEIDNVIKMIESEYWYAMERWYVDDIPLTFTMNGGM